MKAQGWPQYQIRALGVNESIPIFMSDIMSLHLPLVCFMKIQEINERKIKDNSKGARLVTKVN